MQGAVAVVRGGGSKKGHNDGRLFILRSTVSGHGGYKGCCKNALERVAGFVLVIGFLVVVIALMARRRVEQA